MKNKALLFGVIAFIVVLLLWVVGSYNGLVTLDEAAEAQWANVESSYQRRFDLIPNLVETVAGAANFEQETQTKVAELRTGAAQAKSNFEGATTTDGKIAAMKQLDGVAKSFSGLNINVERYPELKATANFADLQAQLEGTENRINVERNRYNEKVRAFNTKVRKFPTVIIANMLGFEKKTLFESDEGASDAVKVDFN